MDLHMVVLDRNMVEQKNGLRKIPYDDDRYKPVAANPHTLLSPLISTQVGLNNPHRGYYRGHNIDDKDMACLLPRILFQRFGCTNR